jgi:hypothetical protein
MGTHYVYVNGLCASRPMGRDRAIAAAHDAAIARPDAAVTVQRIGRDASPASTGETVAVIATGRDNVTPDTDHADAWRAADLALADVVAWRDVADAVDGACSDLAAARYRVAATRQTSPFAYGAAVNHRDAVADRAMETVRDAVADAAAGIDHDAVSVVVVPAARCDVSGLLQRAGVSWIRRGTPSDAGAAWLASHAGAPAVSADNVAVAVAYACGDRKPARIARGRVRRAVAPSLPELRADAAAGRRVSLSELARVVSMSPNA